MVVLRSLRALKIGVYVMIAQLVIAISGFIVRKLFVQYFGIEFLGYTGLFSDILRWLSFAELGVGTAIIHFMYLPLSEKNHVEINSYMSLYKRIYNIIGYIVIAAGLIIMLFLPIIIRDASVSFSFIRIVFIIELISTVSSYFLAYYRTFLYANQSDNICALTDSVVGVVFLILKIIAITWLNSYLTYLCIITLSVISSNLVIRRYCYKKYPFLSIKQPIQKEKLVLIFKDTKNVLVSKLATLVNSATDGIIISSVIGIVSVGRVTTYTTIFSTATNLYFKFISSAYAGIGDLSNTENNPVSMLSTFKKYNFINCCVLPCAITSFIILTNHLIALWLSPEYIVGNLIVWLFTADFVMAILHVSFDAYTIGLGLFNIAKKLAIIRAIVNLVMSVILVYPMGMEGVFLGTVISQSIYSILQPYYIYKRCFKVSCIGYWKTMLLFGISTAIGFLSVWFLTELIFSGGYSIFVFFLRLLICMIVPNIITIIIFHTSEEFKYVCTLLRSAKSTLLKK